MTRQLHVVRDDTNSIQAVFEATPEVLQKGPAALNDNSVLFAQHLTQEALEKSVYTLSDALVFEYQFELDAAVDDWLLSDLFKAVATIQDRDDEVFFHLQLKKLTVLDDESNAYTLQVTGNVYILRGSFPLSAFAQLDSLSERPDFIVDGKLQMQFDAALVFGHKDDCYALRG